MEKQKQEELQRHRFALEQTEQQLLKSGAEKALAQQKLMEDLEKERKDRLRIELEAREREEAEARDRDRIALQYCTAYADIFELGVPRLRAALARWETADHSLLRYLRSAPISSSPAPSLPLWPRSRRSWPQVPFAS